VKNYSTTQRTERILSFKEEALYLVIERSGNKHELTITLLIGFLITLVLLGLLIQSP